MKKVITAVLTSVVILGGAVLNVSAVVDFCSHEQTLTATHIEPRSTSYSHGVTQIDKEGHALLVGCTVTTVTNVEVTTCTGCGAVTQERVIATYGPYHSIEHD